MRATIKQNETGTVTLSHDDFFGDRVMREFVLIGSRVMEYDSRGNVSDVYSGLSGSGWYLDVSSDGLLATIRREWNRSQKSARPQAR